MLTYQATPQSSRPPGYDRPLLLLLLCFIWIITGLWGHMPWKAVELQHIAPISHFARNGLGLIPMTGGEPVLHTPPLYYWIASLSARLLQGWLPLHDAARLATGVFAALALLGAGQATRILYGARSGRLAVLALLGCIGMVVWGHFISSEIAALAGFALTLWGCAAARAGKRGGSLILAAGVGVTFWSATLLHALLVLGLPFLLTVSPFWRQLDYIRGLSAAAPLIALLCGSWPLALWLYDPHLLLHWLTVDGTVRLQLAPFSADGLSYYLRRLPWLALPALPLAGWALWQRRGNWGAGEHLGLLAFGSWFITLSLVSYKHDVLSLPMLLALSIIAAGGIDSLRRGAAAAMNWFGMLAFGLFGLYVWVVWSGAVLGVPERLGAQARVLSPDFQPELRPLAVTAAVLFSLIWLWAITRKRPLARQAITNWTLGTTLLWGLVVALTLPWFDSAKSYDRVSHELLARLPATYHCIDARGVSPAIRGALAYYGDARVHTHAVDRCDLLLTRNQPRPGLQLIWSGGPGWARGKELLYLYRLR